MSSCISVTSPLSFHYFKMKISHLTNWPLSFLISVIQKSPINQRPWYAFSWSNFFHIIHWYFQDLESLEKLKPTSEASIKGSEFYFQPCTRDCKWQMNKRFKIQEEMKPLWEWEKKSMRVPEYNQESIPVTVDYH